MLLFGALLYSWYNNMALSKFVRKSILKKNIDDFGPHFQDYTDEEKEEIVQELIQTRQSGTKLFEMIGVFEILQDLFLDENQKALIPLLQLRRAEVALQEEKERKADMEAAGDEPFDYDNLESKKSSVTKETNDDEVSSEIESIKNIEYTCEIKEKLRKLFIKYLNVSKYDDESLEEEEGSSEFDEGSELSQEPQNAKNMDGMTIEGRESSDG